MRITIASLALLISNSCFAQEQVKHIGVFVEPYYRAAVINGVRFQLSALLDLKKKAIQGAFFVHD